MKIFLSRPVWLILGLLASALGRADVAITVDSAHALTANGPFRGFGIEEDSNLLWTVLNRQAGCEVPADFDRYFKPRLAEMKMPWVRKFIDLDWFAATPGKYTWDTMPMQGVYTSLQADEAVGSDVMLTLCMAPEWLTGSRRKPDMEGVLAGTFPVSSKYYEAYADAVVALMRHLYGADGSKFNFRHVAYLCAPNELSGTTIPVVRDIYVLLNRKLIAAGIRDRVVLFGPDQSENAKAATRGSDAIAAALADPALAPLLGFVDWHEYNAVPGAAHDADLAVRSAGNRQVWVTETNDKDTGNNGWEHIPNLAIDLANHGQAAVALWDLADLIYNTGGVLDGGKYGLWSFRTDGYRPKTSYYVFSIVTSHVSGASEVLATQISNGGSHVSAIKAAAFRSLDPSRACTFFIYNLDKARPARFSLAHSGSAPSQMLYRYLIDPNHLPDPMVCGDHQGYDKKVNMPAGAFADELPPGAFAVYSSLNPRMP